MSLSAISFSDELNPEQYAAVTAPPGPALVLAGAGSGKTRTLTYRVAYLLLEAGVRADEILLLTFTNKAAKEMLERVMDLTGSSIRPRWGGTFHSVGGRIIRAHADLLGLTPSFTILDQDDAEHLLQTVIKEANKDFLKNKDNPKASRIGNLISYARNTLKPLAEVISDELYGEERLVEPLLRFAKLYAERKITQNVADYDDLLVFWLRLMQENPDLQAMYARRFRYILVDEYQDTNNLQSQIIDSIGTHHNIMAVGDDAQCIYTWRGASFDNIRDFPDRHPGTKIYKIETNYRSSPQILGLANAVLAAQPVGQGYAKELKPVCRDNVLPSVVPIMDTRQQAQFIARRIEGLYQEGYGLRDIAILYRAHFQALDAQLELSRQGIPFVITSGVRFFEQAHIRDFVAQLRAVANPADESAFVRLFGLLPKVGPATVKKVMTEARALAEKRRSANLAMGQDLFGAESTKPSDSIFAVLTEPQLAAKIPADAREDFVQLCATMRELDVLMYGHARDDHFQGAAPADVVQKGIAGWYGDYIKQVYPNWQSRREDLDSLISFAARFDTMQELLTQLVLLNSETSDKSAEPDQDAVRMTTVHQAKGLEYPVVFVLCCAEEFFPLKRSVEDGNVEEERRLFYVAVTRAKDELYLCYPQISNGRGSGPIHLPPSRFLLEIPNGLYEKVHFRPSAW